MRTIWHRRVITETNGAICSHKCTSRALVSTTNSCPATKRKVQAMMIPCQWHHTLKYLLKEILHLSFALFRLASAPAKHAKYYGWLTTRILSTANWNCVSAICQALRWRQFDICASRNSSEENEEGESFFRKFGRRRRNDKTQAQRLESTVRWTVRGRSRLCCLFLHSPSKGAINLQKWLFLNAGLLWYK